MIAIWEASLSVGDGAVDGEHRLVMNLLNELDVALTVKAPFTVIDKALEALDRGVTRHFARSATPTPTREHAYIQSRVRQLRLAWSTGQPGGLDRPALMEVGRRWIAHIGRSEKLDRTASHTGLRDHPNRWPTQERRAAMTDDVTTASRL